MDTDDTSADSAPRSGLGQSPNGHGLSRRNLLLSEHDARCGVRVRIGRAGAERPGAGAAGGIG